MTVFNTFKIGIISFVAMYCVGCASITGNKPDTELYYNNDITHPLALIKMPADIYYQQTFIITKCGTACLHDGEFFVRITRLDDTNNTVIVNVYKATYTDMLSDDIKSKCPTTIKYGKITPYVNVANLGVGSSIYSKPDDTAESVP